MNLNQSKIDRINNIIQDAFKDFNYSQGLVSFLAESTPFFGKFFRTSRLARVAQKHMACLEKLTQAFELGYVPGGIEGHPEEWTYVTLIGELDLRYCPLNMAYSKERRALIQERLRTSGASVLAKTQTNSGYQMRLSVDAILDLEGLSPPMKNRPRQLSYGNANKKYWIAWANEIKREISQRLSQ